MCDFIIGWVGKCRETGHPYCDKHAKMKCVVCRAQATQDCDQTMGAFVCGAPLCNDHRNEHVDDHYKQSQRMIAQIDDLQRKKKIEQAKALLTSEGYEVN